MESGLTPTFAVRTARRLRRIADYLDPFGSGDLDKMRAAGNKALASLKRRHEAWASTSAAAVLKAAETGDTEIVHD